MSNACDSFNFELHLQKIGVDLLYLILNLGLGNVDYLSQKKSNFCEGFLSNSIYPICQKT
jgi:hypothetical protein